MKNDDHIWIPGEEYVPIVSRLNSQGTPNGPHCHIESRRYRKSFANFGTIESGTVATLVVGRPIGEKTYCANAFEGWRTGNTGYRMMPKTDLEIIAKSGITEGDFYNSLQTAREARKIYEEMFPGWTLT